MTGEHAIWADCLTKTYRSGNTAVDVFRSLSLSVSVGERLAVIGESGAGKSTLLHILGGLDRPTLGRVGFGGQDLGLLRRAELSRFQNANIGFVWQQPSLLPEFSALENVMMPLLIRGGSRRDAVETANARLKEVGLDNRAAHRAGELSGGEQQRVAVARALAGKPRYLLADEPTGSLDDRTGEALMDLLARMHAAHGLSSIFVTHNALFARQCDRVLELKKGRLQHPAAGELEWAGSIQDATRLDGGTYV